MSQRRLFLDACPGERRGVVTLDGQPERLFVERQGEGRGPELGAVYAARIAEIARDLRLARLDLGPDGQGVMPVKPGAGLSRGALVQVEVVAEGRADKSPVFRLRGPGEGRPGRMAAPPTLEQRLWAAAPGGDIDQGPQAREHADEAEEAALSSIHRLPDGSSLAIEPTRALTAVDVDRPATGPESSKVRLDANRQAIRQTARLLRLMSIGGTVVIDLIGFPHNGESLEAVARAAFEPDQPGVTVLPVSRLGLLQIGKPHRARPLREQLCAVDGALSARSIAQRLVRAMEREGRSDPGARLTAVCGPEVAAELRPLVAELGPRHLLVEQSGWERSRTDIRLA